MSLAALAPFIGNPAAGSGEILPRLLRAAREHLGLEVAFIAEFTDTLRVFRYVDDATGVIIRPGDGDPASLVGRRPRAGAGRIHQRPRNFDRRERCRRNACHQDRARRARQADTDQFD